MQAAIDIQLEEIMKQHPKKKVAMISFSNDVVLIGDATQSPQVIAGNGWDIRANLKAIN